MVETLSDGKFVAPGPYFGGRDMDMGPSAGLRIDDIRVVVSSHKAQLADQAMFRYVGIEPTEQAILVNKSSVHFRADFEPIAERLLICAAPGAMPADPASLPWTKLRSGRSPQTEWARFRPHFSLTTSLPRHRITHMPTIDRIDASPTNSPPSAGTCTPIPKSVSKRSAPPASSPRSSPNGASRCIAGSAAPASSACSRATAPAEAHRASRRHGRAADGREHQPEMALDHSRPLSRLRP